MSEDQRIIDTIAETVTDAVESVLDGHDFSTTDSECSCGLRDNMDGDVLILHRISLIGRMVDRALASVLIAKRLAVVELPDASDIVTHGDGGTPRFSHLPFSAIPLTRGPDAGFVLIDTPSNRYKVFAKDVQGIAAALLAAAAKAQEEQ